MSFVVQIEIDREFEVNTPASKVFEVLSDVPYSGSHFPGVASLTDLGDNTFRWEMKKIGMGSYSIHTIYACKYTHNKKEGWIKWEPVKNVGNGKLKGYWEIESSKKGTKIRFHSEGELKVGLPTMLKLMMGPLVVREFEGMVDKYIKNLRETFNRME